MHYIFEYFNRCKLFIFGCVTCIYFNIFLPPPLISSIFVSLSHVNVKIHPIYKDNSSQRKIQFLNPLIEGTDLFKTYTTHVKK